MGRIPYSEFQGSRVRFQRLADQQVFSGWLQEMKCDRVHVSSEEPLRVGVGDRFLFQIQGSSADAYFIGVLRDLDSHAPKAFGAVHGSIAAKPLELAAHGQHFEIVTQIQMRDVQQLARKAVDSLSATVSFSGKTAQALVADASAGGVGIILWDELTRGDVVEIAITGPSLEETFLAQVRHCRPERRLIGAYRVGLQFQDAERIALINWRKLIN